MDYICGEELGRDRHGIKICGRRVRVGNTKCSLHDGSPKKPSKVELLQAENDALRIMLRKVVSGDRFDEKELDKLLGDED